jgi:beta-carotene hydroxylase
MISIDQQATRKYAGAFAWPTLVMALAIFAAFAGVITLALLHIIPLWLAAIANIVLAYMMFTPMHEAAHNNIRGNHKNLAWVENLVGHLCGIMLLGPFACFKFIHLTHHAHTNEFGADPDTWVHGKNPLHTMFRCFTILPFYYYFFFSNTKRAARKLFWPAIYALLIYSAGASVLFYFHGFTPFLYIWILPAIVANGALAFILDYLPHVPHDKLNRYQNSNVVFGKAIYILSMAHSFHIVHHLWPRIPFYSYRQAFTHFESDLKKEGTPIFGSLWELIRKTHS